MPTAPQIEFGLYLPQLGFSWQQVVERVQAADVPGYHSAWSLDHFYPP